MPIYAYRCATCGHAKDQLQKISDPVLTVCPACGAPTFQKQVTAAGFQLKGSGWYVTDFRGDGSTGKPALADKSEGAEKADKSGKDGKGAGDAAKPEASSAAGSSTPAAGTSSAPAGPAATTPSSGSGAGSGTP